MVFDLAMKYYFIYGNINADIDTTDMHCVTSIKKHYDLMWINAKNKANVNRKKLINESATILAFRHLTVIAYEGARNVKRGIADSSIFVYTS